MAQLRIIGPNVGMGGEFHVHAEGCKDTLNRRKYNLYESWTGDFATKREVIEDINADFIAENEGDPTWGNWAAYAEDVTFFPCCVKDLK